MVFVENQPFGQNKVLFCFYLIFPTVISPTQGSFSQEFLPSCCSPWIGLLFAISRSSSCFHWKIRQGVCSGYPVNAERHITWKKTMKTIHFHEKRPKLWSSETLKMGKCEFNCNKLSKNFLRVWRQLQHSLWWLELIWHSYLILSIIRSWSDTHSQDILFSCWT